MFKSKICSVIILVSVAMVGCSNDKTETIKISSTKVSTSDIDVASIIKSAKDGNPEFQFKLGEKYRLGENGVSLSTSDAFNWYIKAATQGHGEAQMAVAKAYQNGDGVPKNMGEAFNWYQKVAATSGMRNAEALLAIAEAYKNGNGVPKNRGEAINWYNKAAELGNSEAKTEISKLLSGK